MNITTGVIKTNELGMHGKEEIVVHLHDQGAIRCGRIKIKRNGCEILTNTYVLTFNRLDLPTVVNIGFLRVRVEKYIPHHYAATTAKNLATIKKLPYKNSYLFTLHR